jgi:hypothetical protein
LPPILLSFAELLAEAAMARTTKARRTSPVEKHAAPTAQLRFDLVLDGFSVGAITIDEEGFRSAIQRFLKYQPNTSILLGPGMLPRVERFAVEDIGREAETLMHRALVRSLPYVLHPPTSSGALSHAELVAETEAIRRARDVDPDLCRAGDQASLARQAKRTEDANVLMTLVQLGAEDPHQQMQGRGRPSRLRKQSVRNVAPKVRERLRGLALGIRKHPQVDRTAAFEYFKRYYPDDARWVENIGARQSLIESGVETAADLGDVVLAFVLGVQASSVRDARVRSPSRRPRTVK